MLQQLNNTIFHHIFSVWKQQKPYQSGEEIFSLIYSLAQKIILLISLTLLVLTAKDAFAASETEMEKVGQGTLFYKSAHDGLLREAPMLETDIDMKVTGFINRTHLKQIFHNDSNDWVEGVYVFPLPENAAVDHMRIVVGERVIEGKIRERKAAKKIYEQAKKQGKRASLLEQQRPNIFTTSVANIGPNEKVTIEIELQQTLRYEQGKFRMRFPLAITPRYNPGKKIVRGTVSVNYFNKPTDQVPDADRISPIVSLDKKVNPVSIHIEVDAGFSLNSMESTYHSIHKQSHGEGRYTINLAEGNIASDHDFELVWEPAQGNAPKAAMFRETVGNEHFYLVMMLPPEQQTHSSQALAREVIYVIDTSGSMGGVSIRQARKALLMALERLRPRDTFNVIEFNSDTDSLFDSPRPASSENVARARSYVAGLTSRGGTEMLPAMQLALKRDNDSQRLRQIIFLTDGAIGNENSLFEHIRHKLGNSRLFTVGIGSAPNSHFMTKAAQFGRGTFTYISDVNEVAEKMQTLFAKLDTPVMRDLSLLQHFNTFEISPANLPDLYAGEPLMFTARSDAANGEVKLLGKRNQQQWQARFYLQQAASGYGIGKLWARNKIDTLLDSLHDGADAELVRSDVVKLALAHHLVSKYTSLVAVDVTPSRPQDAGLKSKAVATNLPKGQVAGKIFALQAKTGTGQYLYFLTGSVLLLIAIFIAMTNHVMGGRLFCSTRHGKLVA